MKVLNTSLDFLKINDSQFSRISISWLISFLFRFSFMLGWTVITAIFINRIGIESLPLLFVGNALLVMFGSLIFSEFIKFVKKEILISITLLIAATLFFTATTFVLPRNETAFLLMSIIGVSLFLGQVNILIQLYVEDLFSPIESEKAFPLIETSETIGGIAAGLLLTITGTIIAPYKFLYMLMIISLAIIPIIAIFKNRCHNDLPNLNLKKQEKIREISHMKRIEEGWAEVRKTGFLQGIIVVILCQFIIFNLVEFQFTKAIQQEVSNNHEQTLVQENNVDTIHLASISQHSDSNIEKELTQKLGLFNTIINIFALLTQVLLTSRIIKGLGIINSLLIHPLLMLVNFTLMTLKFNISTTLITKTGFEMTRSIFQTAYLSSYYSIKEELREEIKEFIEGIIVPLGAIIGTIFILFFEHILIGNKITLGINITMLVITGLMSFVTYNLQNEYTKISSKTLKTIGNTADKLTSIEILSQKGHAKATSILLTALQNPYEKSIVKVKILEALTRMKKKKAIPVIIKELENPNTKIRTSAVNALIAYKQINQHFFKNAFARFRMTNSLKKLFEKNCKIETKKSIIKILAQINEHEVVTYLINLLENAPNKLKLDCIKVIGLFHDQNSVHFIEKFLHSKNIHTQCAAMESLWQYDQYKKPISSKIKKLLKSKKQADINNILHVIGILKLKNYTNHIKLLLKSEYTSVQENALKTLIQLELEEVIEPFVRLLLNSKHNHKNIKTYIENDHISKKYKTKVINEINKIVSIQIHNIFIINNTLTLREFSIHYLKELRRLYSLLEKDHEVLKLDEIIEKHLMQYKNRKNKLATT